MKVYLVHHVDALSAEQDPQRHISPKGREQADRLGQRLRALGIAPVRILHSDKQWTIDTAQRIAAKLGAEDRTAQAAYPINTGDPLAPFMAEIAAARGDIMMCGHVDYLLRAASHLVCRDERRKVVEFKPGNGTAVCIEGEGDHWAITFAWRDDHAPG
ncbi:MAG: histidine phosphatase family protein [Burkholderiales bacterium]|nr:histidine phosphatase family protein [Burkholderiales bacterium]